MVSEHKLHRRMILGELTRKDSHVSGYETNIALVVAVHRLTSAAMNIWKYYSELYPVWLHFKKHCQIQSIKQGSKRKDFPHTYLWTHFMHTESLGIWPTTFEQTIIDFAHHYHYYHWRRLSCLGTFVVLLTFLIRITYTVWSYNSTALQLNIKYRVCMTSYNISAICYYDYFVLRKNSKKWGLSNRRGKVSRTFATRRR